MDLSCFLRSRRIKALAQLLAACLLSVLLLAPPARGANGVLVIDYPDYWPFFTCQQHGEMSGFFYEIVTEALERMDVRAQWRCFPWTRCQANVKNGESEAMLTVPTPERLEFTATHPDPFYMKELHVFTYKNHPALHYIKTMKSLDDIKVGGLVVVTYSGNGWNDRNIKSRGIKIYEAPLLKSVWRMLANQRGDIAIEWPLAAWADVDKTEVNRSDIVETDVVFDPMPFHLLISKKSPMVGILGEFNEVVLEMKKSGRIDEIVRKYTNPQ